MVTVYRRRLPHWRQHGATYFVTFRLGDSLPQEKLELLRQEKEEWMRQHAHPTEAEWAKHSESIMAKVEQWLDQGQGSCLLAQPGLAAALDRVLPHFEGQRYWLFGYVVMPNHIHAVVRPRENCAPESILQSWKRFSAVEINRAAGRQGPLWQEETFDRIVRDTAHLRKVIRYLQKNQSQCPAARLWLIPEWTAWLAGTGG